MKVKFVLAVLTLISSTLTPRLIQAQTWTTPPFDLGTSEAKFAQNVSYGAHERNKLDAFLPKTAFDTQSKTPVVIYIHGGGFTSGSKEAPYGSASTQNTIKFLLSQNIAFISINYPLLVNNDTEGVNKSLHGVRRAIQYVRRYANNFNILTNKVLLMGTSAGASASLWVAMNNDMAIPTSTDITERYPTRVQGVVGTETQGTLDLVQWETIFSIYGTSLTSFSSVVNRMYGISSLTQLYDPSTVAYRQSVDILPQIDSGDPEVWVANENVPEVAPTSSSILFHHPYHAKTLRDQSLMVGHAGKYYIPVLGVSDPSGESMMDFILRILQ